MISVTPPTRSIQASRREQHLLKRVGIGRFSAEKLTLLGCCWAKHLDAKHPELNFAKASGLVLVDESLEEAKEEVDLEQLGRSLKRAASDATVEDLTSTLKAGDLVTVVRRTSCNMPH